MRVDLVSFTELRVNVNPARSTVFVPLTVLIFPEFHWRRWRVLDYFVKWLDRIPRPCPYR